MGGSEKMVQKTPWQTFEQWKEEGVRRGYDQITPKQLDLLVKAAHEQRQFYLEQQGTREQFARAEIPRHVDIYFKADGVEGVRTVLGDLGVKCYEDETTNIMTARIPAGFLGRLRQNGYAIGKIVKYTTKEAESFAQAAHIVKPNGERIKFEEQGQATFPKQLNS